MISLISSAARAWARGRLHAGLLFAVLFMVGCTTPKWTMVTVDHGKRSYWSGRLGLTVDSQPPQSYFAGFTLQGSEQTGELTLMSPVGSTLAVMQWRPGQALLRQGEQTQRFASLDALVTNVTGTPLPVRALFGWLNGVPEAVEGWHADISQLPNGRLTARRLTPPTAELRVILER
ncbi:MAG: outer membrane lipoprotein LolB [Burkholderiaceae bacterium]|jgi:outer membrane lipoprotein LolB|nr:outer membrane lipoprotein LolB [Burkholderiaceae bacterium]